jgi:hypothetical protein
VRLFDHPWRTSDLMKWWRGGGKFGCCQLLVIF